MKLARTSLLVLTFGCFAVTAMLISATVDGAYVAPEAAKPPIPLSGGASSVDELIGEFVAALAAGDPAELEKLRVDETEYRKVIMPGSVKPGQPPQRLSTAADEYFWQSLNGKSVYSSRFLISQHGGRRYRVKDVAWLKGIDEYAWFRCYDRLSLTVIDEAGEEQVIDTGSVAEVGGRFKFISFIRD